jgi:PD-(D/E)XK endonuclease
MKQWERFTTFKQRGEWVELQFMAAAAQRQFAVSKPWGDTRAYDVGIEHGQNFLRVQVKSTTRRCGAGYLCQFKPNHLKRCDYSLTQIDLFAAYVIPENAWYLIPAALLLGEHRKTMAMLSPVITPAKRASYRYECYREAWNMLKKDRATLLAYKAT